MQFICMLTEVETGGSPCFFRLFPFCLLLISLFWLPLLLFLISSLTSEVPESLIPSSTSLTAASAALTSGMSSSTLQAKWYAGKGLDQPSLVQLRLTEPEVKGEVPTQPLRDYFEMRITIKRKIWAVCKIHFVILTVWLRQKYLNNYWMNCHLILQAFMVSSVLWLLL